MVYWQQWISTEWWKVGECLKIKVYLYLVQIHILLVKILVLTGIWFYILYFYLILYNWLKENLQGQKPFLAKSRWVMKGTDMDFKMSLQSLNISNCLVHLSLSCIILLNCYWPLYAQCNEYQFIIQVLMEIGVL